MSDDQDRRVHRSRRTLWEALLALLHERDWADISVQMICDRADVARSTFYAHFQTKQDLLDEGFAQGAAQLETLAAECGLVGTLDWLLAHLQSASGFHRRLQGSPAGHGLYRCRSGSGSRRPELRGRRGFCRNRGLDEQWMPGS
jgi:AcrR family transcriptional regulator